MPDDRFKVVAGPDQPVADNLAITQCLNQYCHLVDRGSVDEIVALFADDPLLRTPYQNNGEFEGRAAISAWYEAYDVEVRTHRRHRRHKISVPFITIDGNTATCTCYLDSSTVIKDTNELQVSSGRYDDKLSKIGGTWLFQERVINIHHIHRVATFDELG